MDNPKYSIKKIMKLFNLLKNNKFVIKLLLPMLAMNRNVLFLEKIKNNNNNKRSLNNSNNNSKYNKN